MPIRSSLGIGSVNMGNKVIEPKGFSSGNPAPSGYWLAQNQGGASGLYWIKSASMPTPLQMWVDMTAEGGGYDYYPITNGISVNDVTATHSGTALGLGLIYPRSQAHWASMYNYITGQLSGLGSLGSFTQIPGAVYRNTGSGSYTGSIMRSGSVADWRVPDGGRWWLRDSTFTEPNGDYTNNGFLGLAAAGYSLNSDGSLTGFNDGGSYSTGTSYLVSTNAKP